LENLFYHILKTGKVHLYGVSQKYLEIVDDVLELKLACQFGFSENFHSLDDNIKVGVLAYQSAENKYEYEKAKRR
jgi:hypothetical protein